MDDSTSVPTDQTVTPPPPLRPEPRSVKGLGKAEKSGPQHVVVVVLGDVGRSPRMQYHAMSLVSHGVRVTLVGYTGERCISAVEHSPRVVFRRFDPPLSGKHGRRVKRTAYLLFAFAKALALLVRLLYELVVRAARPDAILVQNPPSMPGLACVYLACLLRKCPMVLDWHNLGFSMFDHGPRHPLVWITRRAEGFFGRRTKFNLTVSHAMSEWVSASAGSLPPSRGNERAGRDVDIKKNFAIPEAYVVYDKPPYFFRPPTLPERHDLFRRLEESSADFAAAAIRAHASDPALSAAAPVPTVTPAAGTANRTGDGDADGPADRGTKKEPGAADKSDPERSQLCVEDGEAECTLFTKRSKDGAYDLRRDRPALLVSSTSWTPDEDFSVLLEALERFDSRTASGASPAPPFVVVVVTGKGPEKAKYLERIRKSRMSRVAVCTAWLEPEDYPVLLGSADLGVCLHTSTSGVDLPMKVVDMFGCGVPVCAVHFDCLKELVKDGFNGCVFKDSTQLALQLGALLDGFPKDGCELGGYGRNVSKVKRWKENWDECAWPLFASLRSRLPSAQNDDPAGDRSDRELGGILAKPWSPRTTMETMVVTASAMLFVSLFLSLPPLSHRVQGLVAAARAAAERWCAWAR